jgi:hypothetical protein
VKQNQVWATGIKEIFKQAPKGLRTYEPDPRASLREHEQIARKLYRISKPLFVKHQDTLFIDEVRGVELRKKIFK